jgi:hypothetical protein
MLALLANWRIKAVDRYSVLARGRGEHESRLLTGKVFCWAPIKRGAADSDWHRTHILGDCRASLGWLPSLRRRRDVDEPYEPPTEAALLFGPTEFLAAEAADQAIVFAFAAIENRLRHRGPAAVLAPMVRRPILLCAACVHCVGHESPS